MGKNTKHVVTFQAGEDLSQYARVKIESGTLTDPPEVIVCAVGEQGVGHVMRDALDGALVAVRIFAWETKEGIAAEAFVRGATLYGAASGGIQDTSNGSAIGIALEVAGASGDIVKYMPFNVLSTTAATVSFADSAGATLAATVEAALAELYADVLTAQAVVQVPLTGWMLSDGTNTVTFGGPATDPILDLTNGDTDSALRWVWAAASVVAIINSFVLPPDIDVTADIVLHMITGKDANADTVTLSSDTYFMVGDTKVSDTSATLTQAVAESTITIGNADITAGDKTATIELTPSAHAGDALYLWQTWIEYTRVLKTS